jgi:hypothetical protein
MKNLSKKEQSCAFFRFVSHRLDVFDIDEINYERCYSSTYMHV